MEDHELPEAIAARANQEDPIVMYLIVRELGMSVGKIAAQVGHAVQMLGKKRDKIDNEINSHIDPVYGPPDDLWDRIPETVKQALKIWDEWDNTSFRKVTLTADEKEWVKLKAITDIPKVIVVDAGLTEIASGSETVIGLWPMRKSERPKLVKKLQVLK